MKSDTKFLGIGLYTVAEASRLTGVSAARIHRWLRGYHYRRDGQTVWVDPLWQSQIPEIDGAYSLGFRDLAEIRVVDALIGAGLNLWSIRKAIGFARTLTKDERPFSTTRFKTDGHSVFLELPGEEGDERVIELLRRQYGFREVILPTLRDLEFDAEVAAGGPCRPSGKSSWTLSGASVSLSWPKPESRPTRLPLRSKPKARSKPSRASIM